LGKPGRINLCSRGLHASYILITIMKSMESFMLLANQKALLPGLAKAIALAGISSLLLACGGGGGGGSADPKPAPKSSVGSSVAISSASSSSQAAQAMIKVNQIGFLPESSKLALVPEGSATQFKVIQAGTDIEIFSGELSAAARWEPANESVKLADFSSVKAPGDYRIRVEGFPDSHPFTIADD